MTTEWLIYALFLVLHLEVDFLLYDNWMIDLCKIASFAFSPKKNMMKSWSIVYWRKLYVSYLRFSMVMLNVIEAFWKTGTLFQHFIFCLGQKLGIMTNGRESDHYTSPLQKILLNMFHQACLKCKEKFIPEKPNLDIGCFFQINTETSVNLFNILVI